LLYADGAFHGLTCGALSLMGEAFWREGFGPLLPGTEAIPFNRVDALQKNLATKKFAAFIVEPIQSEAGIRVPSSEYFRAAQELCQCYGTLLVLDEVQTGMYRTGPFLAAQKFGVDPDMVVLAKALSGGLVPVSAVLMSEAIYDSVYGSLRRAIIHTSTFSENSLAMRAALATLAVLESENLGRGRSSRAHCCAKGSAKSCTDSRWSKKFAAKGCCWASSSPRRVRCGCGLRSKRSCAFIQQCLARSS
jgi:ornithine--oxo-acid transaminase